MTEEQRHQPALRARAEKARAQDDKAGGGIDGPLLTRPPAEAPTSVGLIAEEVQEGLARLVEQPGLGI